MLATSRFYAAVRQFSVSSPVWDADRIIYHTLPDERRDLTLVSQRVYGNRDDFLAVMAAAGLDRFDDELTEREIVLPSKTRLDLIKRQTGFAPTTPKSVR
jgi:hypothetical protein